MPIYNAGDYIKDSLNNLLNQTLKDIEIICVNDGSSDNSLEIIEDFSKKDSRVKIINQENSGASIARNKGMKMAQGDFIHFIDADDIVAEDILEKLYYNAINNDSDFAVFKVARFDEKNIDYNHPIYDLERVFPEADFDNFGFTYSDIKMNVLNVAYAPWTKFYRREFLEKNKMEFPDISAYNDILFHVKSMLKSSKISFVPEFLYFYRLDNVNSITNDPTKHFNIFNVIKSIEDFLIEEGFMDDFKYEFELFKLNQISRHMVVPISKEYFNVAKDEFLNMNPSANPLIKNTHLDKYKVTLNLSESDLDKFEEYFNLVHLQNKKENLENKIEKLDKILIEQKDIHENLSSSYSWKITKPLRAIKNHSFKELLLNKSNSYVFYKDNYSKLKKSNKKLIKKNKKLDKDYEKIYMDNIKLIGHNKELIEDKNHLIKENKHLILENTNLTEDKERLIGEKNKLTEDKNDLNEILASILNYAYAENYEGPKISVIVPVYNVEEYLDECLDSIINQTLKDIEIICVNDGSTDNSLSILESYEKLDERIKVLSKENGGQSSARNLGMENSKGDFIYFADSDDYLELNALEKLYHISSLLDLDILIFKQLIFEDETYEKFTSDYYQMSFLKPYMGKIFDINTFGEEILDIAVSPPSKLFKRSLISSIKFPEGLIFEDNLFFAEAMLKAKRVSFLDKHFYNRRIRNDSTTTNKTIKFADSITISNKIIYLFKEFGVYNKFKKRMIDKKIHAIYHRFSQVDEIYKEEFFKRIQEDFKKYEKEFKDDHVFLEEVNPRNRHIFNAALESENYWDFELKVESFA